MPVYYKEKPLFFEQALDSILNQTLLPDEIVIVKDGPLTKELDAVIEKYISKYSNLLKSVENHTKDDYMKYLFSDSNERKKLTIIQKGLYLAKILFNKIVKAIIFLIPITFVIYSIAIII